MYALEVLDIIDMVIDFDKMPADSNTLRLRRAVAEAEDRYDENATEFNRNKVEKAVKDYHQYYLNCNNHAIAQNKVKVDMVHSPSHYKLRGLDIESVDVIRSVLSDEEYKGWCKGNALKYLFRAGKKDDEIQDLSKCSVYLKWLTDKLTNLCK